MIPEVPVILDEMLALHKEKSEGYGSDQDPAANFTAVAGVSGEKDFHYPILRSAEKITRMLNLYEAGRYDEMSEEFKDVALLMVLCEAMRRRAMTEKKQNLVKPPFSAFKFGGPKAACPECNGRGMKGVFLADGHGGENKTYKQCQMCVGLGKVNA